MNRLSLLAALPLVVSLCLVGCKGDEDSTSAGASNLTAGCDPNAHPPAPTPQGTVLFNPNDKDVLQPVDPVEGSAVLGKLFETFLTDEAKCSTDVNDLADAREKGQFVPSVSGKITGSFTAAKKDQTLYLVSLNECGASHADNFGSALLVVVEAGNVVARNPIDGGSSVHRVVDIDGDGRSEVVVTFAFSGQGTTAMSARLVRVRPEGIALLKDFGGVLEDTCDSGDPGAKKELTIVRAVPKAGSSLPDFTDEKHTDKCPPP